MAICPLTTAGGRRVPCVRWRVHCAAVRFGRLYLGLVLAGCDAEIARTSLRADDFSDRSGGDAGSAGGAAESDARRGGTGSACANRDAGADGSRTRPRRSPASGRRASCNCYRDT